MSKSKEERKKQKRECERRRRQKIKDDPAKLKEHNRKRREAYAAAQEKRAEKKANMSDREKRNQRRCWKLKKRDQRVKKRLESQKEPQGNSRSVQAESGKLRRDANRKRREYLIGKLEVKLLRHKKRAAKYKKQLQRLNDRITLCTSNSPRSKCKRDLKGEKVSPRVKKQLVFGAALQEDLTSSYSSIKSQADRKNFTNTLNLKYTKKYNFMTKSKPFFPWNVRKRDNNNEFGVRKEKFNAVRECVRRFYESDDVSIQAPGKKEVVVRNKIPMQKR